MAGMCLMSYGTNLFKKQKAGKKTNEEEEEEKKIENCLPSSILSIQGTGPLTWLFIQLSGAARRLCVCICECVLCREREF